VSPLVEPTARAAGEDRSPRLSLGGRLDAMPLSRWHIRSLTAIATAHFFDGFDVMTIALVLPVLIGEWGLSPRGAALAISAGFVGQMLGAVLFGHAAERYGRLKVLRIALIILSLFSLLSAFVAGLPAFIACRVVQGLGLGGETPVAATYINELCPARLRGRVVFSLQMIFALGVLSTAFVAVWAIPTFGWRFMFVFGALPLILALVLPRLLQESPLWLAEHGRWAEANAIISRVERDLAIQPLQGGFRPEPVGTRAGATASALFRNGYAGRTVTVWAIALCIALAGFGVSTWMPSLYRTVYHLSIEQSLRYGLGTMVTSFLGALVAIPLIDTIGRRWCFVLGFSGGGLPLIYLALQGMSVPVVQVVVLAGIANAFFAFILAGIYVYAPEIYPTRIRAIGAGCTSAWLRTGAIGGPLLVGLLLPDTGVTGVFAALGSIALIGAVVTFLFAQAGKGRSLEDVAA
jgi:putative MFS transporter